MALKTKHYIDSKISDRVWDEMFKQHLLLKDLQTRSGLGRTTLWEFLYNNRNPSLITFMKICGALNVSTDYIIYGKK